MQKTLLQLGLLLVFACSPQETLETIPENIAQENRQGNASSNTPNTGENQSLNIRSKADILAYFEAIIAKEQIIVGQHCGNGPDEITQYYNSYIDMLADESGRHVALMGADMGFNSSIGYPVRTLIDHWNDGGLVTLSWHADNPFLDGYDAYWNTVENRDKINLRSLLRGEPQTEAWTSYRNELDTMAGALQKLRDAGVTVIWRPFHEMNGDFFWWGMNAYNNQQTNQSDYVALWQDLYKTLTYDYGLDNLIWTYSVIPHVNWNADVTAFYPGDDYVDLVGMDYYGATPDFPDYNALKSLGKTIVMSESGPMDEGYGNWNMMQWADILKGKAAYFLQWHSWNGADVAIKDNKNTIEMMNSTVVITRGEVWIPN